MDDDPLRWRADQGRFYRRSDGLPRLSGQLGGLGHFENPPCQNRSRAKATGREAPGGLLWRPTRSIQLSAR